MLNEVQEETKQKMDSSINALRKELSSMRTGRASLAILDNIRIDYYGSQTPLNQVASLAVPEPQLITIQPWENKLISVIEKALQTSDLGLSTSNDGKMIRLPIPPLTQERRLQLVKQIKKMGEDSKVSVRNHRREAIEDLKSFEKEKEISEDDLRRGQDQIQKLTDAFIEKINQIVASKEKELMEI